MSILFFIFSVKFLSFFHAEDYRYSYHDKRQSNEFVKQTDVQQPLYAVSILFTATFSFNLVSNLIIQSPTTRCLMDLFSNSLDMQLSEVAYAASVASLRWDIQELCSVLIESL